MMRYIKNKGDYDSLFSEINDIFNGLKNKVNEEFYEEVPLPGLSKDEVEIEVINNCIVVKTKPKKITGFVKKYENDYYSYWLTSLHDLSAIDAKMENGLLTIKVPLRKKNTDSINVVIK